jgi:hypothetical protein
VSINLPHYLAEVLNFLGFAWPDVDEDELRAAAVHLRLYAQNAHVSAESTQTQLGDMSKVYSSQSYVGLVQVWSSQSRGHMDTLIEGCDLLAKGLDVAATGIEVMKDAVIVQLGLALAEFVALQAAAVATLGVAEAGLPALQVVQNRLLNAIVKTFEAEVIMALLHQTLGPVKTRVEHAVNALVFPKIANAALGETSKLKVDTAAMRRHSSQVRDEAEGNELGGHALARTLSGFSFGGGA